MATSKQKIRVYVSKVETSTGETLVVKSNFHKKDEFNRRDSGIRIYPDLSENESIEMIKNYMISFFRGIMVDLEEFSVKFDVDYFFNREYSAKGQLLYYGKKDNDKDPRFFREMFWVDLIKPLTNKEIELFIKALRKIKVFNE